MEVVEGNIRLARKHAGMPHRKTLIVHMILAGHMSRVDCARSNETGVQIMTMGQLAARLAGGLLQPVNLDVLWPGRSARSKRPPQPRR